MSRPRTGFRFTTAALAVSPLLPILGEQTPAAPKVISLVGLIRWHLEQSVGLGPLIWLLPSIAALVSLLVPTRRRRPRLLLALGSLAVAVAEMAVVLWPSGLGRALGVGALVSPDAFARHALMMLFFTIFWAWIEIRPYTEESP